MQEPEKRGTKTLKMVQIVNEDSFNNLNDSNEKATLNNDISQGLFPEMNLKPSQTITLPMLNKSITDNSKE